MILNIYKEFSHCFERLLYKALMFQQVFWLADYFQLTNHELFYVTQIFTYRCEIATKEKLTFHLSFLTEAVQFLLLHCLHLILENR